jgi:hypothetical protein
MREPVNTNVAPNRHPLLWVALLLLVLASLWYLFRPERAFLNETVDEPFPGMAVPLVLPRAP